MEVVVVVDILEHPALASVAAGTPGILVTH